MLGPYMEIILFSFHQTPKIIHNRLGWSSYFLNFIKKLYDDSLRNPETEALKSQTVRELGYYRPITW